MKVTLIRAADYARATWKNGLGHTDQIAIEPPGADLRRGDFLWRISSARIERSSPFSPFPEHDRILVVLEGDGVKLVHDYEGEAQDQVDVPPLEPYEFPGDVPTRCELKGGAVRDLSVFFAKGRIQAQAEVAQVEGSLPVEPVSTLSFLFIVRGSVELAGHRAQAGDTLRLDAPDGGEPLEMRSGPGGAELVAVHFSS